MSDSNTADVVYLDFANAFISVDHMFLLAKLESFSLCEKFVQWSRSYLTGRTYRVRMAEALPQDTRIQAGVPQG